jgi:Arc/MetJ-type ribon-helix-helix transcriptional regulator
MSIQIAVRLSEEDVAALDEAIARGRFRNRASALRQGLERLLREEHEREIDEAYHRGYGEQPQEDWVGEAGLAAFAAFVATEEKDADPL